MKFKFNPAAAVNLTTDTGDTVSVVGIRYADGITVYIDRDGRAYQPLQLGDGVALAKTQLRFDVVVELDTSVENITEVDLSEGIANLPPEAPTAPEGVDEERKVATKTRRRRNTAEVVEADSLEDLPEA